MTIVRSLNVIENAEMEAMNFRSSISKNRFFGSKITHYFQFLINFTLSKKIVKKWNNVFYQQKICENQYKKYSLKQVKLKKKIGLILFAYI